MMTGVAVSCVARRRGAGERTIELDQMTCDECASHFNRTTHGILQCAAGEQSVLLPVLQVRLVGLQPTHRRFAVLQHNFFRIAADLVGPTLRTVHSGHSPSGVGSSSSSELLLGLSVQLARRLDMAAVISCSTERCDWLCCASRALKPSPRHAVKRNLEL